MSLSEKPLNTNQEAAVKLACDKRFTLVTGGAGTGKTRTIEAIAKALNTPLALCAPTGKAAARIRESTGMEATTIHRLLGYRGGEAFTRGDLMGIAVIVDEASMAESSLLAEIVRRSPARLVLVGDAAQLMPVGRGAPFHTLLAERPDLTTTLDFCFRNSEAIFKAASAIRNGQMPVNEDVGGKEKWKIVATGEPESTIEYLKALIVTGDINFDQDVILCYKNDDVALINHAALNIANPAPNGRIRLPIGCKPNEDWQIKDRIICGDNFPAFDTWNGTTGTITAIDGMGKIWAKGDMPFYLDGEAKNEIQWNKKILNECQHPYALTVHKAQGSQYRKVYFCCFSKDIFGLSRNLIYTAVTRAREECYVLGEHRALSAGIKRTIKKMTFLEELIKRERTQNG